jgi:hypothetical protein
MTEAQALDALLELLGDEERWTQRAMARLDDGTTTGFDDPRATCWCMAGGLSKVVGGSDRGGAVLRAAWRRLQDAVGEQVPLITVMQWQDIEPRRHADIVTVIRRARELVPA